MTKSKLVPFIAIGAVVGACISLMDKQTREHTVETMKLIKGKVSYYAKHTDELQLLIGSKVEQVQSFYTNTSDKINSLMTKAEDAKTLPSTIQSLVLETKDAFFPNSNNKE